MNSQGQQQDIHQHEVRREQISDGCASVESRHTSAGTYDADEPLEEEDDDDSSFSTNQKRELHNLNDHLNDNMTDEDKARYLFSNGVKAERDGQLYDAVQFYRRAFQLDPDIEFRTQSELASNANKRGEYHRGDDVILDELSEKRPSECEDDKIEDLMSKFGWMRSKGKLDCETEHDQKVCHISELPCEVLVYIFKWVMSSELDSHSVELSGLVCRWFYLCARDSSIWKAACVKVWGANDVYLNDYESFRDMFFHRSRVRYNGVYISKTTYFRLGENSFQDATYRPWHVVEYFRYIRFFPDGVVILLTTPESPVISVSKLKARVPAKTSPVLVGQYSLQGGANKTVTAVLRRSGKDNSFLSPLYRGRNKNKNNGGFYETGEQTFRLELQVKNFRDRFNYQLIWKHYSIHTVYKNGQETITNFDISANKFPPLWFSRVKSYARNSPSPLVG